MNHVLYFQADDGNRTRDLRLTKATLYRLSHISTARNILAFRYLTVNKKISKFNAGTVV